MRSDSGNFWWILASSFILFPLNSFANDAGHSIAAKFAGASNGESGVSPAPVSDSVEIAQDMTAAARSDENDGDLDARLKADEEAMLERAREEAEQRRLADKRAAEAIVSAARRARQRRVAAKLAERRLALLEKRASEAQAKEQREAKLADDRRAFAKRLADRREERKRVAELDEARRIAQAERRQKDEALRKVALAKEEAARAAKKAADLAKTLAEERRAKAAKATREREAAERKEREAEARLLAYEKRQEKIEREKLALTTVERERTNEPQAQGNARGAEADESDKNWEEMRAEREAEARRLSEKLARVRARREDKELGPGYSGLGARPADHSKRQSNVNISPPALELREPRRSVKVDRAETRATILLVMEPGNRGIRRFKKTADPILCLGKTCYIGNGSNSPARSMSRRKAFGPAVALGQRAGRCGQSLVCVFRGVEVGRGAFEIQPIDLRIMRHDRREVVKAELDWSCKAVGGSLRCLRPIHSRTYRAWIVPESIARDAGMSAINAAIDSGLRDWAETALPRKR